MKLLVSLVALCFCSTIAVPTVDINAEINLMIEIEQSCIDIQVYTQTLIPSAIKQVTIVADASTGVLHDAALKLSTELDDLNTAFTKFIDSNNNFKDSIEKIAEYVKTNVSKLSQEQISAFIAIARRFVTLKRAYIASIKKMQIFKPIAEALLKALPSLLLASEGEITVVGNRLDNITSLIATINGNIPSLADALDSIAAGVTSILGNGAADANNTLQSISNLFNEALNSTIVADSLTSITALGDSINATSFPQLLELIQSLRDILGGIQDLLNVGIGGIKTMIKKEDTYINLLTYTESTLATAIAQIQIVADSSTGNLHDAALALIDELDNLCPSLKNAIDNGSKKLKGAAEAIAAYIKNKQLSPATYNALVAMAQAFNKQKDLYNDAAGKLQIISKIADLLLKASDKLVGASADAIAAKLVIITGLIADVDENLPKIATAVAGIAAETATILSNASTNVNEAIDSVVELFNEGIESPIAVDTLESLVLLVNDQNIISISNDLSLAAQ